MIGHPSQIRHHSERSATHLAVAFQDTAAGLAGDLCQACRPMLPVHQALGLRVDELSTSAGLERQSPMAAAVMALGPAIAAAGVGVASIPGMAWEEANRIVDVGESVVGVGLDALDALADGSAGRRERSVAFAHRLAHATHLATALAPGPAALAGSAARGYPPRAPALWPQLLELAEHADPYQAALEGRARPRRLAAPRPGRLGVPRRRRPQHQGARSGAGHPDRLVHRAPDSVPDLREPLLRLRHARAPPLGDRRGRRACRAPGRRAASGPGAADEAARLPLPSRRAGRLGALSASAPPSFMGPPPPCRAGGLPAGAASSGRPQRGAALPGPAVPSAEVRIGLW